MKYLSQIGQFFTKSKKRLVILSIVILLAAGYMWAISDSKPKPTLTTTTPTPTKALTVQEQNTLKENKTRFIAQLPIDTPQYLIEYFPDRDYFFVQIRQNPYQQYKTQIENFFRSNGVDPNYATIEWGSVRGVAP
ncbi:MAG: hypothetical protein HY376_04085 [Candidatus Blackburnbacteria bacterium]|nr:hypothetical protein [Candidatus Blackburnbacteria bacterium]